MADNAKSIKAMNVALPRNTDPRGDCAKEIRTVKACVKNSFPNVDKPVTASSDLMNKVFSIGEIPTGMVWPWFGTLSSLPPGWAFCDGGVYNGYQTQDLRGMSLFGYGSDEDSELEVGDTVGKDSIYFEDVDNVFEMEEHSITIGEMPRHAHRFLGEDQPDVELPEDQDHGWLAMAAGRIDGGSPSRDAYDSVTETPGRNGARLEFVGESKGHTHKLIKKEGSYDNRSESVKIFWITYVGFGG